MEIDTVYQGSMTTGFGSIAKFETGLDLYRRIAGVWFKVGGGGAMIHWKLMMI